MVNISNVIAVKCRKFLKIYPNLKEIGQAVLETDISVKIADNVNWKTDYSITPVIQVIGNLVTGVEWFKVGLYCLVSAAVTEFKSHSKHSGAQKCSYYHRYLLGVS